MKNPGGLAVGGYAAIACVAAACGGSSEEGVGVALTIPVGSYTGCTAALDTVGPAGEGGSGGSGTVNLSTDGAGGLSGVLALELSGLPSSRPWFSGTIGFAPTSSTTAALSGGPFDIETLLDNGDIDASAGPGFASTTVPVAASSLALVGNTLFISVYGQSEGTSLSGYCVCPVPASLPRATVVNRAPKTGSIPTGTYRGCTMSFENDAWSQSGGDSSLTIAESDGMLTATSDALLCGRLAFHNISGSTATLSGAQTCTNPGNLCGPGPSSPTTPSPLGVPEAGEASTPGDAMLTNGAGSIHVVGGALFINVTGDAPSPSLGCGSYAFSVICSTGP
jgi:hypothetical protein